MWSDLGIEPVWVHSEVMGGISQPDKPGQHSALHLISPSAMPGLQQRVVEVLGGGQGQSDQFMPCPGSIKKLALVLIVTALMRSFGPL